MKINKWKFHLDYEKEEAWLNEMSAQGKALTSLFLFRFTFTDCKPGEFIYRTEVLSKSYKHPESQQYISFMTENGVDLMAAVGIVVYFRRKAEEGPFDIYSDLDSRLAHYRRVSAMWLWLIFIVLLLDFASIPLWLWEKGFSALLVILAVISLGSAVVFLVLWNSLRKKIGTLKKEKILRE